LEIAWDALKLLEGKVISASFGCYWGIELGRIQRNSLSPKQFFKALNINKNIQGCQVCARGSIMLSTIRLGNTIDPDDYHADKGDRENVQGFDYADLINMEGEYEDSSFFHPYYYRSDEKLMNILCNVLINGNFNTLDDTDYLIE